MIKCNNKVITIGGETMLTNIIKIGNSKGVRIPAYALKKCNITEKVDLEIVEGKIILIPIDKPRKGWDEKFKSMNANGDDILLIDDTLDADLENWKW